MFARRASTWRLMLLVMFAAGSFAVEEAAPFTPALHTALQLAIFLSALALIWLWVRHDAVESYADEAARLMLLDLVEVPSSSQAILPNGFPSGTTSPQVIHLGDSFRVTMSLERQPDDPPETSHATQPDRSELE